MSEWKKTTCVLCAVNCGIEVQTYGNRITKVRGDKDCPRSEGYVCRKGMSVAYFQSHAERLTHPLKRVGDNFEKISWEQATGEIAARCETLGDEVIVYTCDLDRCREIQDNIFNFALHREPESYGLITATKGVVGKRGEQP